MNEEMKYILHCQIRYMNITHQWYNFLTVYPYLGVIEEYSTSDEALSTAGGAAGMIPPVGVGEDCIGTNPLLLFCDLFFLSGAPPLEVVLAILPTPPEELWPKRVVTFITASCVTPSCYKTSDKLFLSAPMVDQIFLETSPQTQTCNYIMLLTINSKSSRALLDYYKILMT